MAKRAVVHIDIDSFFASVELKKRPELKGRPVIVGGDGDPAKRGVVSTATYEARKAGVRSGIPMRRAAKLCPEAVFLPVDFESYERESERFMEILADYGEIESFGLDEAFIEAPQDASGDAFPYALKIAREIRERVKREAGLTVSVGIAPNKLLAKMACDMGKPDGFFVLKEEDVERTLKDLPVRKLWGVGAKTEARLKVLGAGTIGELTKLPLQHLERNFGPVAGRNLYDHCRGIDASRVVPFHEPQSISREVTFEEDTQDLYIIRETLYALTEDLTARLKSEGQKCRRAAIKMRFSDFETVTRSTALEPESDSLNDIWPAVSSLIEEAKTGKAVRLVGVKATL